MATTTPNYGWDVPTSTDYVAQGAVAIETLGDDIDASMYTALLGKRAGLVPLASQSVTGSSNVIFDNVFTSDYRNYKIFFDGAGSTSTNIRGVYRTSGSVDASGNYDWLLIYAKDNVLATSVGGLNVTGGIYFNGNQTQAGGTECTIFAPFVTGYTSALTQYCTSNGSNMELGSFGNIHRASTSIAGIRFVPGSGTLTGTFSIYGVRNFA